MVLEDGRQLGARQQGRQGELGAAAHLGEELVKGVVGRREDLVLFVLFICVFVVGGWWWVVALRCDDGGRCW